jgi:hypothetical protein
MKKLTKAVLAILVVASSITACKKGEDDPGMSLKSRKGRLSQEWSVSEYKSDITDITTLNGFSGITTFTTNTKTTYTASTATKVEVSTTASGGSTSTTTDTYSGSIISFDYTFDKDGTWSSTMTVKWTSLTTVALGTTNTFAKNFTETTNSSGNWYFLGKNKNTEDKNKENLTVSVTSMTIKTDDIATVSGGITYNDDRTITYANNENNEFWHLSRLAKDELVADIMVDTKVSGKDSETEDGVTTSVNVGPNSSKGSINLTLAAK